MNNGLTLHCGAHEVPREVLDSVPTPESTQSWCPIPHADLLGGIQGTLECAGYRVTSEAHALAKDGARYFGLLEIVNGHAQRDYSLVVGLRNSHDKSIPAGLVIGSKVFVCDNLAFSGEIRVGRKHTVFIERDLPNLIDRAVGRLGGVRGRQDHRISSYKNVELSDAQAHDLIIQALDARVVTATRIPDVVEEWRNPRHPEFRESKTAWRLFNGFTEILKGTNLFRRPVATQALHGVLDGACNVN